MMNIDEIDNDIVRQLENNGLKKGDREQRIKLLLTHAYMAIRMYWAMSPEDRVLTSEWHKKFRRSFSLKKFLKEGKRHGERKIPPCTPFIKKDPLEKGHKMCLCVGRDGEAVDERRKKFWTELEQYIGKYDRQMVLKFYYYWAEEMKGIDQMRWEIQKSWNTSYRLAAWSKRSYNKDDQAAELRLAKAKGKQQAANQQTMTAERDDNNARLEQEIAERKAGDVSYEEWLKMKD
jgi:hypothetical protein